MKDVDHQQLFLIDGRSLVVEVEKIDQEYYVHSILVKGPKSFLRVSILLQSINGIDYPFLDVSTVDVKYADKSNVSILSFGTIADFNISPNSMLTIGTNLKIEIASINIKTDNKSLRFWYDEKSRYVEYLRLSITNL